MKFKIWLMTPALAVAILWGCYESADIAFHEPGIYKGRRDPLLDQRRPEEQQQLIERFKKIQTDR
ncbi:MAG: hypothetical protein P8X85_22830 [Desulfobacterales bacterium]